MTRSERLQEREEIATEVFGTVLGMLRKMIQFDPEIQTYVSIAGDDEPEMRRTVGIFAADRERQIDLRIEKAKRAIESCHTFALQAATPEERDLWNRRTRVHAELIERLEVEKIAVRRLLVMEIPWPDLIRVALGVARKKGNLALLDAASMRALEEIAKVSGDGSSVAPSPPPAPPVSSSSESESKKEDAEDEADSTV